MVSFTDNLRYTFVLHVMFKISFCVILYLLTKGRILLKGDNIVRVAGSGQALLAIIYACLGVKVMC